MNLCQQTAKKPSWSLDSTEASLLDRLLPCEIVSVAGCRSKGYSSSGSGLSEVAEPVVAALTGDDEKGFVTMDEQEPPRS